MSYNKGTKVHEVEPPFRKGGTVVTTDAVTGDVCVRWPDGTRTWNRPSKITRSTKPRGGKPEDQPSDDPGKGQDDNGSADT